MGTVVDALTTPPPLPGHFGAERAMVFDEVEVYGAAEYLDLVEGPL